ncbi:MAG TPA: SBBP repeat-containing protein [Bryobacteraceae bacterium]|nr:SBBP repeat-containing protein [Bryobacteraceae bacterium]
MRLLPGLCALSATFSAAVVWAQEQHEKRLVFSTYQGGDRNDDAVSAAVDADGFIYVAGESESRDLPGTPVGGKPLTSAVFKGYLTKYAPDGKKVMWRALIGGSSNTVPHAVAVDKSGNVYVAGTTGARDFPLKNPVQDKQTGLNICFLMKFDGAGELLFSTYFGGDRNEEGLALAIDSQGAMYLAGRATSTNLPVKNALQPAIGGGGQDGFIAKFSADYKLEYATYVGGTSGTDNIHSIAVGPDDSLYVTGETMSPGLSTTDAYIPLPQSYSSFVARIAPAGNTITYFTYVGWKGGYTKAQAVAVDAAGRAYVTGHTTSKQLPTSENAVQREYAGGFKDAFLLRLSAEGKTAEYLTYLGGSYTGAADPDETAVAVKVDSHGYVYVAGETTSPDFPSVRAVRPNHGGGPDAYLLRVDVDNGKILSSTLWGGGKRDAALAIALGREEVVTLVGETFSDDYPLFEALQTKMGSLNDSFVAQICDPWLVASGSPAFRYVIAGERPGSLELEIGGGCPQRFEASEVAVDQPWVSVLADGRSVPMKVKVEVNPEGLAPGDYSATLRVTVPEALRPTIDIPVTFTVAEPPLVEAPVEPVDQ